MNGADPDPLLPVACYTSATQPERHRYQAWRDGSLLDYGRRFETRPLTTFAVETVATALGPVGFSHARMSAQEWVRSPAHARGDGVDDLTVAIRFEGIGRGDFAGRAFEAPPGSIVLSDFAAPQAYASDAAETAVLAIPRALAERSLPRVRSLHGLVIAPAAALLLRSHARALVDAIALGMPARHADRLGQVALDLLAIAVAQAGPATVLAPDTLATGARAAAEMAIDRALASPSLTIANLCRSIGVSRATLYRLFEVDGGVQAFITRRRLARVEEELRWGDARTVADLAERWGFREPAHLSRLFRATYGQSPIEYRASHAMSV